MARTKRDNVRVKVGESEGRVAFQRGYTIAANPFFVGQSERWGWYVGFLKEKEKNMLKLVREAKGRLP